MKQPTVKVDGAYYKVDVVFWSKGNISFIAIEGKTIFPPSIVSNQWYSLKSKESDEYVYHTVEFVEEVTA